MKLINLGCGTTFHSDWVNLDLTPNNTEEIISYDIRQKLPYPDNYFDVCYSSHVLEHLAQEEAKSFLQECQRILKPSGILRIVVPDLEDIARNYLNLLEKLKQGYQEVEADYDWILLELLDQMTRSSPGGEMKKFLLSPQLSNQEFILSRIGKDAQNYWETSPESRTLWQKIQGRTTGWWVQKIRLELAKIIVFILCGANMRSVFQAAIVRSSGENHRWMYDSFSLARILKNNGFTDVKICQANESRIPYFNSYQLDVVSDRIRKPDSLFMEGRKQIYES